jgi:hypothetical protein
VRTPIPAPLEALVMHCLAKERDDRPPSAEWLAARLVECPSAGDWTPDRAREWWESQASARGAAEAVIETHTTTADTPLRKAPPPAAS